jgi:hypothetical protein
MKPIAILTEKAEQLTELITELGARGHSCVVMDPRTHSIGAEAAQQYCLVLNLVLPTVVRSNLITTLVLCQDNELGRANFVVHEPVGQSLSLRQLADRIENLTRQDRHQVFEDALSHMADWDAAI